MKPSSFCLGLLAAVFCTFFIPGPAAFPQMRELSLDEAFRIALENNERIDIAYQQYNQARMEVSISRSFLFPQVSLQAEAVQRKETSFINLDRYRQIGILASQSIYEGGRLRSGYAASRYAAESLELDYFRTRQTVLFRVASTYYNVLLARRYIEIAEHQLTRAERQLQLSRERMEVGLVDQTAVLRARVEVAAAMERIERAENRYKVAMEQLALEMGITDPPESVKEPEPLQFDFKPVSEYIDQAFENRRDMMAAGRAVEAAEERIGSQKADYFPDLSLQGSYTKADEEEVFYGTDNYWQVELIASYPLFTGFRRSAQVARAEAAKAETRAGMNRLRREIRLDVRSAYADISTSEKVIASLEDQVEAARANYEQVIAQFEEGLVSSVDVVDAETAFNESELRLATAYYQLQLDQLNLKLASGVFAENFLER